MEIRRRPLSALQYVIGCFNAHAGSDITSDRQAVEPIIIQDDVRDVVAFVHLDIIRRLYPDMNVERIEVAQITERMPDWVAQPETAMPCIVRVRDKDWYAIIPVEDLACYAGLSESDALAATNLAIAQTPL